MVLIDQFYTQRCFESVIFFNSVLTIWSLGIWNLHSQQQEEEAAGEELQPTLIIVRHVLASKSCQKNQVSCFLQTRNNKKISKREKERCVSNAVAAGLALTSHTTTPRAVRFKFQLDFQPVPARHFHYHRSGIHLHVFWGAAKNSKRLFGCATCEMDGEHRRTG